MTLVTYHLRILLLRQSLVAPVLTYVALVALVYASPAGPPYQAGGVTAVALLPVGAWTMRLASTAEGPSFGAVTLLAAGGAGARHLLRAAASFGVVAVLGVVAVVWGAVANPEPNPATTLLGLLAAHVLVGAAGVGLGGLVSPPLVTRPGGAVAVVVFVTGASVVVPGCRPLSRCCA